MKRWNELTQVQQARIAKREIQKATKQYADLYQESYGVDEKQMPRELELKILNRLEEAFFIEEHEFAYKIK